MSIDPAQLLEGTVFVVAPHMDDEMLACGGTLARLPIKERIHLIFATDGSRSFTPVIPWRDAVSADLSTVRMREAQEAGAVLGIPSTNIHFLGFPDGKLKHCLNEFARSLLELVDRIKPDQVLTPFRYDRHPDHLAVNRVTTEALRRGDYHASLVEYFVYYRWRLLPGRDIRKYIHPNHLIKIDIRSQAEQKRTALNCYKSQTTRLYEWQDRPILTEASLEEVCHNPESFLKYDPLFPGTSIFTGARSWIPVIHHVEPLVKKRKDRVLALVRRGTIRNAKRTA